MLVLDHGQIREINAGKSIVALAAFLFSTGSGNDLSVKDDGYAMSTIRRSEAQAVEKVCPCICHVKIDRFLGTGDHDGLAGVLDEVGHGGGSVCHRISSVADHEAVVIVVILLQDLGELQPVFRVHVRAVDV